MLSVACNEYDVIILVETWLYDEIDNSFLGLSNYNIYRTNRDESGKTRGGGILIAVKKCYSSLLLCSDRVIEHLFVNLKIGSYMYIVGGVYIKPGSAFSVYEEHCNSLAMLDCSWDRAIVCGDYNLPELQRETVINVNDAWAGSAGKVDALMGGYLMLNLEQINEFPNSRGTFLDLIFTNVQNVSVNISSDPLLCNSVHHEAYLVSFKTDICSNNINDRKKVLLFQRANYNLIKEFLASFDLFLLTNDDSQLPFSFD